MITKFINSIKLDHMLTVGLALLVGASSVATFVGVLAIADGPGFARWLSARLMAVAVTFGVELLLVYAALVMRSRINAMQRAKWALVYLVCAAFSVSFGYVYWWQIFRADAATVASFHRASDELEISLREVLQRRELIGRELAALTEYSKQTLDKEREFGGTCRDGVAVAKPGPRSDLRQSDVDTFAGLAGQFPQIQGQNNELLTQIADVRSGFMVEQAGEAEAKLANIGISVSRLAADPAIISLQTTLESRIALGKGEIQDPRGSFLCPDSRLESGMQAVIAAAKMPMIGKISAIDKRSPKRALETAFGQFGMIVEGWSGGISAPPTRKNLYEQRRNQIVQEGAVAQDTQGDILPLVMGAVVDVLILLVALSRTRPVVSGLEILERSGIRAAYWQKLLDGVGRERYSRLLDLIETYEVVVLGRDYVVVPLGRGGDKVARLRRLLRYLEARGVAAQASPWMFLLRRAYKRQHQDSLDGDVIVYRVAVDLFVEVLTAGMDESDDEPSGPGSSGTGKRPRRQARRRPPSPDTPDDTILRLPPWGNKRHG